MIHYKKIVTIEANTLFKVTIANKQYSSKTFIRRHAFEYIIARYLVALFTENDVCYLNVK